MFAFQQWNNDSLTKKIIWDKADMWMIEIETGSKSPIRRPTVMQNRK